MKTDSGVQRFLFFFLLCGAALLCSRTWAVFWTLGVAVGSGRCSSAANGLSWLSGSRDSQFSRKSRWLTVGKKFAQVQPEQSSRGRWASAERRWTTLKREATHSLRLVITITTTYQICLYNFLLNINKCWSAQLIFSSFRRNNTFLFLFCYL